MVTRIFWSTWALTAMTPLPWGYSGISCHQGTPPSLEAGRRLYSSCSTGCVLPQDDGKEKYLFPGKLPQTILLVNLSLACTLLGWEGSWVAGTWSLRGPSSGAATKGAGYRQLCGFPISHPPSLQASKRCGWVRMLCLGQSKG